MSVATDLTANQQRLTEAGQRASAEARKLKGIAPPEVVNELLLQLCIVASESNMLKSLLGSLRMMGELEQRPPPVTAERLELARCVSMFPGHPVYDDAERFAHELAKTGDDTELAVLTTEATP